MGNINIDELKNKALLGDSEAQYQLGDCYAFGDFGEVDYEKAVYWYTKASDQGHAFALCNLGVCYQKGLGVAKDGEKAAKYYELAAIKGDVEAMYNLAVMLNEGIDVKQDLLYGLIWMERAAEAHYPLALEFFKKQ